MKLMSAILSLILASLILFLPGCSNFMVTERITEEICSELDGCKRIVKDVKRLKLPGGKVISEHTVEPTEESDDEN